MRTLDAEEDKTHRLPQFLAVFEQPFQRLLLRENFVNAFLKRSDSNELVHKHVSILPDAMGAIGSLSLYRRIPPTVEMNHMRRLREIESEPAGPKRKDEDVGTGFEVLGSWFVIRGSWFV